MSEEVKQEENNLLNIREIEGVLEICFQFYNRLSIPEKLLLERFSMQVQELKEGNQKPPPRPRPEPKKDVEE